MLGEQIFKVTSNEPIARNTYRMVLQGDASAITQSGQFVSIQLDGFFLRRPISVADYSADHLLLVYKIMGEGTLQMAQLEVGQELNVLIAQSSGFTPIVEAKQPILVGGGVGVPPLYRLAKELIAVGQQPKVLLGFATMADAFFIEEFEALGLEVLVATIDGTLGEQGLVIDLFSRLEVAPDYIYSCGPLPMLRALYDLEIDGQFSFEERMGCGYGACMGCTHDAHPRPKRVCKEGPVFYRKEIKWSSV